MLAGIAAGIARTGRVFGSSAQGRLCLAVRSGLPGSSISVQRDFSSKQHGVSNPHLVDLGGDDFLYHLGLNPKGEDMSRLFSDVKFVCLGGRRHLITEFAETVADELGDTSAVQIPYGMRPSTIGKTDRFTMYKVGPVLISSHGMGQPSMSILLHEVAKLLSYAGAQDPIFIRLGTSGGIGVDPGSVVVTTEGVNGYLKSEYELPILGKRVVRPAIFQPEVVESIVEAAKIRPETRSMSKAGRIVPGKTMAADCFYEGQGRLDGAICEYSPDDKMEFLRQAHAAGVRNIEMESLQFGAFTHRLGIRAATCCVTLLNRLEGDQVRSTPEQLHEWDQAPGKVVLSYIKNELGLPAPKPKEYKAIWTVAAH